MTHITKLYITNTVSTGYS